MKNFKIIIGIVIYLAGISFSLCAKKNTDPYAGGWSTELVQAENVTQYRFRSKIVKEEVTYHVFMPTQFGSYTGPIPTLIWLHGSFATLSSIKPLSTYLQKAMDEKRLKPMAVVFPNGINQSLWVNSRDGRFPVEDVLVKELIPDLKNHFNFLPTRIKPMLAGFSMGGYGAARLTFKYPYLFSKTIAIAGGPLNEDFKTTSSNESQREVLLADIFGYDMNYYRAVNPRGEALKFSKNSYKPNLNLTIIVGDVDKTFEENERFSEYLNELQIKHDYIVLPGVDHSMVQVFKAGGNEIFEILNQEISQANRKYKRGRRLGQKLRPGRR